MSSNSKHQHTTKTHSTTNVVNEMSAKSIQTQTMTFQIHNSHLLVSPSPVKNDPVANPYRKNVGKKPAIVNPYLRQTEKTKSSASTITRQINFDDVCLADNILSKILENDERKRALSSHSTDISGRKKLKAEGNYNLITQMSQDCEEIGIDSASPSPPKSVLIEHSYQSNGAKKSPIANPYLKKKEMQTPASTHTEQINFDNACLGENVLLQILDSKEKKSAPITSSTGKVSRKKLMSTEGGSSLIDVESQDFEQFGKYLVSPCLPKSMCIQHSYHSNRAKKSPIANPYLKKKEKPTSASTHTEQINFDDVCFCDSVLLEILEIAEKKRVPATLPTDKAVNKTAKLHNITQLSQECGHEEHPSTYPSVISPMKHTPPIYTGTTARRQLEPTNDDEFFDCIEDVDSSERITNESKCVSKVAATPRSLLSAFENEVQSPPLMSSANLTEWKYRQDDLPRLRLISMRNALGKYIQKLASSPLREHVSQMSLSNEIDELRKNRVIPMQFADIMHEIEYLGGLAMTKDLQLPRKFTIDLLVHKYRELKQAYETTRGRCIGQKFHESSFLLRHFEK